MTFEQASSSPDYHTAATEGDLQISPRFVFFFYSITETQAESVPVSEEIGCLIEEVVDFAKQINLDVDSDDVQELLDSRNQVLVMDELIEMHEQEQDIEELEF
ncbi:hypothetical protein TNCV_2926341 [Trichonephila clavipes]|nr:hypothetical protein TNCV_2926341 [Trichonephila clavipes]